MDIDRRTRSIEESELLFLISFFVKTFSPLIHRALIVNVRRAVVKELVETEEEFGRDLQQVVERYLKPLDNPDVPRIVRDNKDIIFTNLKQIADFHNTYVCSVKRV